MNAACSLLAASDFNEHEEQRLDRLSRYRIAGTKPEPRFDSIARMAGALLNAPIALVTLVERNRQWMKARHGFDSQETERSISFCTHTIQSDQVLVVPDCRTDERFADNPLVTGGPLLRSYAGAPLITADGYRLGSLCIADTVPREPLSPYQRQMLQDLAALVMQQMDLRRSEFARSSLLEFANATELSLISLDHEGCVEFANPSASALFGYDAQEMIGNSIEMIVPERMRNAHRSGLARLVESGQYRLAGKTVEVTAQKRDGTEFPIEMALSAWSGDEGLGIGAIIRDISVRRERDTQLLRMASQDPLTGLCNQAQFESLLGDSLAGSRKAAVILIEIDGLKEVNAGLGHGVGDWLLQAVAVRLPASLDKAAVVARFPSDKFAILLADVADAEPARAAVASIMEAFETPFDVCDHIVQLAVRVGWAIGPEHGGNAEDLIVSADFALHEARRGAERSKSYDPALRNASLAQRAMQDELLRALVNSELVLHYQPQVSLTDRRIVGVEALIRWQHPVRGLLLPGAFLPALEASALTLKVGWWVLDEACRQMAAWQEAGIHDLRVGVNFFAAQFREGSLKAKIGDALARHRLDPRMLEIEVTETIALNRDDHASTSLRDLRDLGVRIAFDDFGTGYASLSTLQRFPLTTLKIDRGFVRDLLTNPHDAAITRAMISMGNDLGLETIAEGIETAEQEAALQALGCQVGQGYLYGKAMAPDVLAALFREQSQAAA